MNAKLFAMERLRKRSQLVTDELEIAKLIASYNKDVCGYCRKVYCEPVKEELCMSRFYDK